ncbi:hypothetical protein [Hymenobacter sp. GOD-10R]|uniref:hypothetical protein n=1 Tax=Hymenobacter sp. GOD-10R TaxID=3093922 RepID=UPI002D790A59|nr:hypothetical protein [Hymenobacter sp. GOD-10R]WRQ30193.1 hypothetical protein SD425_07955 [Hymenobacter sp. GOD-10R]
MSTTRLKRKHRKNIARANNKQRIIKQLLLTPVLKNVDLEELKSRFTTTGASPAVASAPATTGVVASVKEAATSAVDKVKEVAADVADAVAHSDVVEKAKEAVSDLVEKVTPATSAPSQNEEAKVNQTGTEGFDEAEAITKPVNEDGQEGEHPKPEIAL